MTFDDKLEELFIDLPEPPADVGNALGAVRIGKMIYVAGALPLASGRIQYPGRVGIEVRIDNARLAARTAGMLALALVRRELGDTLNRVRRVVRVEGYVACGADFADHAKVVDGASEFFVQVFGPFGKHVRTAVGVASLPRNACVAISAVFEVK